MGRFFKKGLLSGPILAAVMVTLTGVLTYGLFIPRLGYYHDDWYMLWSAASRGTESLISLFSMDRPFMGFIYTIYYRIIGENIAGWHIFALLWKIVGALVFYWILNTAWPKLRNVFILAALLFMVYPGFLAQANAATKINHLTGYTGALLSIACTLQAFRVEGKSLKIVYTVIAMLFMALYLWIYEYMIGLEVMRILLMFWMAWQGIREKVTPALKKLILAYIPYVAVAGIFLYWRVFIFESTRNATDLRGLVSEYQSDFIGMALRLIFQVVKDFFSTTIFAWSVQPYQLFAKAGNNEMLAAFGIGLVIIVLAAASVNLARKEPTTEDENVSPFILVLIGGLSALGAVFPVVLSNRHLDLLDAYKGYGLHPSAGVIIMVVGIVMMMKPRFRIVTLIALLGLSVATQSLNAQRWANFWDLQRNLWWQLTWRAPDLEDETLVMAYLPDGHALQQDYEIWGPINLIYRPGRDQHSPPIKSEVLNQGTVVDVFEGRITDPYVRDIFMPRDYRNLLLISQPTIQSCIHVIDGAMPAYSSSERPIVEKAGSYSDINRILPAGTTPVPPALIFGEEPEHNWCYYYQKASLARQAGDWDRIGDLYDEVVSAEIKPGDASEYFVFIEGLVNLGRDDEAFAIVNIAIKENTALKLSLCQSLSSAPHYSDNFGYRYKRITQIVCE